MFRTPLFQEKVSDQRELFKREAAISARAGATAIGALLSGRGTIAAIRARGVASEFAADSGTVALHDASDLRLI